MAMSDKDITEHDMERARWQAWKSVILQELAKQARNGKQEWASQLLKRADEASLKVNPKDLTRIKVNAHHN